MSRIATKLERKHLMRLGAVPSHPHDASLVVADVTRFSEGVRWQPSYDLDRGLDTTIVVGGATTRGSPRQAVTEI